MILIADSGSTKTSWRGISGNGEIIQWEGRGINPLHLSDEEISIIISKTFDQKPRVGEVYFYGAGSVGGSASQRLKRLFGEYFATPHVHVADDMLAVARGVCDHDAGIACILGTGANSCFHDGRQITNKHPAPGLLLGSDDQTFQYGSCTCTGCGVSRGTSCSLPGRIFEIHLSTSGRSFPVSHDI